MAAAYVRKTSVKRTAALDIVKVGKPKVAKAPDFIGRDYVAFVNKSCWLLEQAPDHFTNSTQTCT
jgi:hypothetical protein